MTRPNTPEDFHNWYIPEPMSGCWLWLGASPNGRYGAFKVYGQRYLAHVYSFLLHYVEDIPEGYVVDHICRNTFCVNPEHLQLLTQLENTRRTLEALKTHCKHGHPYADGVFIYKRPNKGQGRQYRRCLTCYRLKYNNTTKYALEAAANGQS